MHGINSEEKRSASGRRKRALIVNCYFDDSRQPLRRTTKIPQAMGPVYLAGAFSRERCDVRVYTELYSGPLEDEALLSWPDMLVLTGLTNSFDRMLHLTAYARTKNPKAVVVAGGPAVRALPLLARQFFDYACAGDIEQLAGVITDAFGPDYVAEEMLPRFDLAYWIGWLAHVESTRYCNFRCSFCALTGEGHGYQTYELDYVRKQLVTMNRRCALFIDNNFYGSDRRNFQERVGLIAELRRAGHLKDWGALVTNDFFNKDENLDSVREAGCRILFSGVESFDAVWLRSFNKLQNTIAPQVSMMTRCLTAGIVFIYGLMVDVTSRRVGDLRRELEFITGTPEITLPSFITSSIPLLGTPYFHERVASRALFPSTKLRDMDGLTVMMQPLDPLAEVVKFMRDVESLRGYRRRVLRHSIGFARRYRSHLNSFQMALALGNAGLLCAPKFSTGYRRGGWRGRRQQQPRTYISTTEPLDAVYTPAFRVASRFEKYFQPVMVTDESGNLSEELINSGMPGLSSSVKTQAPATHQTEDERVGVVEEATPFESLKIG
ncbi:MAG: hopanoid methylase [Blastocatellia bacterium]|nr:hopanoid methylase [Blastocatellia bacterium]